MWGWGLRIDRVHITLSSALHCRPRLIIIIKTLYQINTGASVVIRTKDKRISKDKSPNVWFCFSDVTHFQDLVVTRLSINTLDQNCHCLTGYQIPSSKLIVFYSIYYVIIIIIMYHDFLPTPRRGCHVKSGKTQPQSSRYTP